MTMNEALQQALDCADFCRRDLQAAMNGANAVEAMVLLPLIEQAAKLTAGIMALKEAREQQP